MARECHEMTQFICIHNKGNVNFSVHLFSLICTLNLELNKYYSLIVNNILGLYFARDASIVLSAFTRTFKNIGL